MQFLGFLEDTFKIRFSDKRGLFLTAFNEMSSRGESGSKTANIAKVMKSDLKSEVVSFLDYIQFKKAIG
jgi:hypothetical protein